MIDLGWLVIGFFVVLFVWIIWAWRGKPRSDYPGGIVTRLPGERQEGAGTGGGD